MKDSDDHVIVVKGMYKGMKGKVRKSFKNNFGMHYVIEIDGEPSHCLNLSEDYLEEIYE